MYHTEANSDINKEVGPIVENMYLLREIEHSKKVDRDKFILAKPIIDKLIKLLTKKNNFLLHRIFWNELHDRMGYYFDYLNKYNLKNCQIPLIRTSLHNRFASWFYQGNFKNYGSVVVHVDSHDDLQLPDPKGTILKSGYVDRNGMIKGGCSQINYTVTCLLLSGQIDRVAWMIPNWVYDDNYQVDQLLTYNKKSKELMYYRSKSGSKKDNYRYKDEIELVSDKKINKMKEDSNMVINEFELNRIRATKVIGWKKVKKILNEGESFILNIDLDYFVTNGDKYKRSHYQKYFDDLESDLRVHGDPGIRMPREMYTDDKSLEHIKLLRRELKAIDKRIDVFIQGLRWLNERGHQPSLIGIAGSTPSFFSGDVEVAVYTNNYTPKYFVPYLQARLIKEFKKLYGNKSFL